MRGSWLGQAGREEMEQVIERERHLSLGDVVERGCTPPARGATTGGTSPAVGLTDSPRQLSVQLTPPFFFTHGQQSAAQGSPTNCLSTLTLPFKLFDSSAL
jgi:hypothetical protein